MKKNEVIPDLSKRLLRKLHRDTEKSAEVINLIYVNDKQKGIERRKEGEGFSYYYKDEKITDDKILSRIKALVIPPAWEQVWICKKANGHLQATGVDAKGRKQYRYHNLWSVFRNTTKFSHLAEFGKKLHQIREAVQKDLAEKNLNEKKVLALIVSLLEETTIRIGSSSYEKLYGSYGLTTLKDQHVKISGAEVKFSFKGKKGVYHEVNLKSRKLANLIKKCKDIPGKELFQYFDSEGNRQSIESGMVNDYIKSISGGDFTAKDFRTWNGTIYALAKLNEIGCCENVTEARKKIVEVLDHVAKQMGNTRAVCKKYYVHPMILELYETSDLQKFWTAFDKIVNESPYNLKPEEKLLMNILETNKL